MFGILMMLSCGLNQVGEAVHANDDGIWTGPSFGRYDRSVCYAVALDYPDGYDWRSGSESDRPRCQMLLLEDGIPVLKIPVGEDHMVSAEAGRQRVIEGHLYTDHTDGMYTAFKKDGRLLYYYEGAELIEDVKIVNGVLHTLGVPPDGEGFRYRVNGETVVERESAHLYRHMDVVSDTVIFYFHQSVSLSDGQALTYNKVKDGKVFRLEPDLTGMIYDIRMSDDDMFLYTDEEGYPSLMHSGIKDMLEISLGDNIVSSSILNVDKPVVCIRYLNSISNDMTDILWSGSNRWHAFRMGCILTDVFVDDIGYNAAINPHDDRKGLIFCGNRAILMPDGYSVYSKGCMVRKDSVLYVGLSSNDSGRPVIWKQGELDTLDINGPVICLQ